MTALTASERLVRSAEARRDGRHAEALEHHVWFHENAPAASPELRGVRLSFASLGLEASPGPPELVDMAARMHHDHAVRHHTARIGQLLGVLVAAGEPDAARSARELALAAVENTEARAEVATRLTATNAT